MDAILLAGGKGTRMLPLTENTPKPLLEIAGRPIMEWSLRTMRPVADRVLVVVKYLKEQIIAYMHSQDIFERYEFVEQLPEPLGTGHAVQCCAPYLQSPEFLVLNSDDLYSAAAVRRLAEEPLGILTVQRSDMSRWGVAVTDQDGKLIRLHEKPTEGTYPTPVAVNVGAYKLNQRIFAYDLPLSSRGEYELTDYVSYLAGQEAISVIHTDFWLPIGTPADLEHARQLDVAARIFDA